MSGEPRIQPIQTSFKGYKFRSRLEARWAVFFTALGIKWEYEREGYDIDGRWYLPDFWLPYEPDEEKGWGFWVEIKPGSLDEEQVALLGGLAKQTGHRVYAICGNPWPGEHGISVFDHHHHGEPESVPRFSGGILCEEDSHVVTDFVDDRFEYDFRELKVISTENGYRTAGFPVRMSYHDKETLGLRQAFEAARSARFEHGESPPV